MKIRDLFDRGRPLFSFEFFPPKSEAGTKNLANVIHDLKALAPDFISVTYGAGGSTRDRTVELVIQIQRDEGICAMAHLTSVGASREQIGKLVDHLVENGIENFIPLRGDLPADATTNMVVEDGFSYASEMVAFMRHRYGNRLCLAGAAYPEGHPQSRDLNLGLQHLQMKVDAGIDFLVTQLFYDNRYYFDFVARAREAGITVPIIPGIMPILDVAQIERITRMCGAALPPLLQAELDRRRSDPTALLQLGVAQATAQCADLLARGAPGIHFYTLNQSPATRLILTALRGAGLA